VPGYITQDGHLHKVLHDVIQTISAVYVIVYGITFFLQDPETSGWLLLQNTINVPYPLQSKNSSHSPCYGKGSIGAVLFN
jgi:hypothetical protein